MIRGRHNPWSQQPPALEQEAELASTDPGDQKQDQALAGENPASYLVLELGRSALRFVEASSEEIDLRLYHIELGNHAERKLRDFREINVNTPFLPDVSQAPLHVRQAFRRRASDTRVDRITAIRSEVPCRSTSLSDAMASTVASNCSITSAVEADASQ